MKTASQVAALLTDKVTSVVTLLLPQGMQQNQIWIAKDEGEQLIVNLDGPDKGMWQQKQRQGDLLDLWCQQRKITLVEAVIEAKHWLGIKTENLFSPAPVNGFELDLSKYAPLAASSPHWQQLIDQYQLTPDNLNEYKLYDNKSWLIYPYYKKHYVKQIKAIKDNDVKYAIKQQTTLFGYQALPPQTREVVLTLNEIDTMTLHQLGIPSLAIPHSDNLKQSLSWLADEFDYLIFDKIYLAWHDNQQTKLFTNQLRERLGRYRCYQLQLPNTSVNQCMRDGMTGQDIKVYLSRARTDDPAELKPASDYTDEVLKLIQQEDLYNVYQPPWQKSRDLINFRSNELSIWTGINGHGKSQLLGYLMLQFMQQGAKVCIASLELKPERVLLRLNRQLLASNDLTPKVIDLAQTWYQDRLWLFNLVGATKTERLLSVFEYARQRYGIDIFVIDSIMKCGINEDDYNAQKHFVEQLCDFKNEHPVHIHLVAHPRKSQDENHLPNKMDIKGTGSMTDLADNVFSIWRNKNKETHEADAVLQCDKQRNGEWEGKIKLWFDLPSCHYLECADIKPKSMLKPQIKSVESAVELGSTLISAMITNSVNC